MKWSHIAWETHKIHNHRMESHKEDENGKLKVVVVAYTKNKSSVGDQYLPLSDYEINLFEARMRINEKAVYSDDVLKTPKTKKSPEA